MNKKKVLKLGVFIILVLSIAASIAYAEKFTARNGNLIRFNNITEFSDAKTFSLLKVGLRQGDGRLYLMVNAQSKYNDKISLRMDLRHPAEDDNQLTGMAEVRYKLTNNGHFVIIPIPDMRGFFDKEMTGKKPSIKEASIENVTVTFNNDLIGISSETFEINNLQIVY